MITSILSRLKGSGGGRRGTSGTKMGTRTPGHSAGRAGSGKGAASSRGVRSLIRRMR